MAFDPKRLLEANMPSGMVMADVIHALCESRIWNEQWLENMDKFDAEEAIELERGFHERLNEKYDAIITDLEALMPGTPVPRWTATWIDRDKRMALTLNPETWKGVLEFRPKEGEGDG